MARARPAYLMGRSKSRASPAISRRRSSARRASRAACQEHLWNWLLYADEHRRRSRRFEAQAADDRRVELNKRTEYALEGSVFIGGAVVQWLRDGLGIVKSASEIEKLAGSVPTAAASIWFPHSRASARRIGINTPRHDHGITRGTTARTLPGGARKHCVSGRRRAGRHAG